MENQVKRGRKPKDNIVRETKITIKFSEDEMERIEKMAEYLEIPKTVATRNMALMSLEEMEAYKKYGILQVAKGIIKTSDWLKEFKKNKPETTLSQA